MFVDLEMIFKEFLPLVTEFYQSSSLYVYIKLAFKRKANRVGWERESLRLSTSCLSSSYLSSASSSSSSTPSLLHILIMSKALG